ncbi:MAG: formate dehydrogenase accessory protein FdhE [Coriobacteriia bacterium]|nr:formate dehydrogenase accessory protein FdhE [Coriobacteriia bacterium]
MDLTFIDFAIEGYGASLDEGDKARLAFFRELWGVVAQCQDELPKDELQVLTSDQLEAAFSSTKPVLSEHPASIDPELLACTQGRLVARALEVGGFAPEMGEALEKIDWADVVRSSDYSLAGADPARYLEVFAGILVGRGVAEAVAYLAASFMSLAIRAQIEGVAADVVRLAGAERVAQLHATHCPVCGAKPTVARVGGESSSDGRGKTLGCLQCGTSWEFERIRCAHCGTQNPKRLHYFNIEGDDSHRINTCDECGGYMRTTFVEDALAPFSFEVEDVVMAKLDAVAADPSLAKGAQD